MALTELSTFVSYQARMQKAMLPGIWLFVVRYPHHYEETWEVAGKTPLEAARALKHGLKTMEGKKLAPRLIHVEDDIVSVPGGGEKLSVLCFTKLRFLDKVDIKFTPEGNNMTKAVATGYSTGAVPLVVPLAPLLSAALCWLPFYDMNMMKQTWLPAIRDNSGLKVNVLSGRRKM